MSETDDGPIALRSKSETGRLVAAAVATVVVGAAVAFLGRPYELGGTSPITLKASIAKSIEESRKKTGDWPADSAATKADPAATWKSETPAPSFSLGDVVLSRDPGKPLPVERARYSLTVRGETIPFVVRFDPNERTRRKRF